MVFIRNSVTHVYALMPFGDQIEHEPKNPYQTDFVLKRDITGMDTPNKHHPLDHRNLKKLVEIGIALSTQKEIKTLLELILESARDICQADAGTLYSLDRKKSQLNFEIVQNASLKIGLPGDPRAGHTTLPPIPLEADGVQNLKNVSAFAVHTGKSVNIPDVYSTPLDFDFAGPKAYDAQFGYHTRSMLVIPLKDHKDRIIGVLQLINAMDRDSNEIIEFTAYSESLVQSLASQAAVAFNNALLIQNLKDLLAAFIESMATAIDEKSPYTGGHIRRVVDLCMRIAKEINQSDTGYFSDIFLDRDEIEELKIAAWMHDVGKVVTPGHIIDKTTKLETIFDRIDLIELRAQLIESLIEKDFLNRKMTLIETGKGDHSQIQQLESECLKSIQSLHTDLEFIRTCNQSKEVMDNEAVNRIKRIANKRYHFDSSVVDLVRPGELANLCIRKGNLNHEERKIIEDHARVTRKITEKLPFPEELSQVSRIAASHHERPDGSGYPDGLSGQNLSIQSRILALADIFEALTAKDRPYRKPMSLSQAVKILEFMKHDGHIDDKVLDLFLDTCIHIEYAQKELFPEQIDMDK